MKKLSGIYSIVNIKTGRVYIGSSKNLIGRINQHRNLLKNSDHHNPRLRYDLENGFSSSDFEIQIVFMLFEEDEKERNRIEAEITSYYSDSERYNLQLGWTPKPGVIEEAVKARLSLPNHWLGRKHTEETKQKMKKPKSSTVNMKGNPNTGKTNSIFYQCSCGKSGKGPKLAKHVRLCKEGG